MRGYLPIVLLLVLVFVGVGCSSSSEPETLKPGDKMPLFELMDQNGELYRMEDVVGEKNLVVYFYPKDDTPGCTKEACKFRDDFEVFTDLNALVIGISGDSPESHQEFKEKYNLPFTLLSDEESKVQELFGVGGEFMGLIPGRVTFVIDQEGVVQYTFNSMSNAEQHVDEARKILEKLNQ
ncbi:peroxiredoxin [bacterium SCSIO 12643]|nr:peroxiredoxin [bacterium SCSIO 12643]